MSEIISQNNVNPYLTQIEKGRFQQIGDNFFKGAHQLFVEQQVQIIKTVDSNIINNEFIRQQNELLSQYRESVMMKNQRQYSNDIGKVFCDKLDDFLILCGIGLIAIKKYPDEINRVVQYGKNVLQDCISNVKYIYDKIDANVLIGKVDDFVRPIVQNFILFVFDCIGDGYDLFFNGDISINKKNTNLFFECISALVEKIVKRTTGVVRGVGLIFDLIMGLIKKESYKKPLLKHWLLYGTQVYDSVKQVDDEFYNFYKNVQDTKFWWFQSNSEIGRFVMNGDKSEWYGVAPGEIKGTRKHMELQQENVKKEINNFHLSIQEGAKQISSKDRVQSLYGIPSILDSPGYIKARSKFQMMGGKSVDISGLTTTNTPIVFSELQINLGIKIDQKLKEIENAKLYDRQFKQKWGVAINTAAKKEKELEELRKSNNLEEFKKANKIIYNFYNKHKDDKNPIAKKIIDEIIHVMGSIKEDLGDTFWLKHFVFIPPIYYAILQYEHMRQRNEKVVASLGRKLIQTSENLKNYKKEKEKNEIFIQLDRGEISFEDFATKIGNNMNKSKYGFRDIEPEKYLSFCNTVKKLGEKINQGMESIEKIVSEQKSDRGRIDVQITDDDYKRFGEVYFGNEEYIVNDIIENAKFVKNDLKNEYGRRYTILDSLKKMLVSCISSGMLVIDKK